MPQYHALHLLDLKVDGSVRVLYDLPDVADARVGFDRLQCDDHPPALDGTVAPEDRESSGMKVRYKRPLKRLSKRRAHLDALHLGRHHPVDHLKHMCPADW